MSKLLIDEKPLQVLPGLAVAIGLNEAIALQQVHFWLTGAKENDASNKFQDGKWWVYNTYQEWQATNFPFWSVHTIQRVFLSLEERGLLISEQLEKAKYCRRKWYTIDYEAFRELEQTFRTRQIGTIDADQDGTMDTTQNGSFSTEITTENTTEILSGAETAPDAPRYAVGQRVVLAATGETGRIADSRLAALGEVEFLVSLDEGAPRWAVARDFSSPPPPADPPTPPTPKRGRASKTKPAEHKPRADDPLFDLIAQRSFGVDPRGPDVKPLGGRIGVLKGIAVGKAYDVVKLQAAYDWYKKHRKGCTSPRGAPAFTNMLNDYDAAHKPALQLAEEPELDAPHAYLKRIREERDRVREAAFLSAS